jgi:hypothetical protein
VGGRRKSVASGVARMLEKRMGQNTSSILVIDEIVLFIVSARHARWRIIAGSRPRHSCIVKRGLGGANA